MIPIAVTAHLEPLDGRICIPRHPIALDALLGAAICMRDNLPPARCPAELLPLEIPIALEPAGRFYLASFSVATFELMEREQITRQFPVNEYVALGNGKMRRVQLSSGHTKMLPLHVGHLVGDSLQWWAVGDRDGVRDLLRFITHLGKKRAVRRSARMARRTVRTMGRWLPRAVARGRAVA